MRIVATIVLALIAVPFLYYLWSKYSHKLKGCGANLAGVAIGLFAGSFVLSAFKVAMGTGDEENGMFPRWMQHLTYRQIFVTDLIVLGAILVLAAGLFLRFWFSDE